MYSENQHTQKEKSLKAYAILGDDEVAKVNIYFLAGSCPVQHTWGKKKRQTPHKNHCSTATVQSS